MLQKTLHHTPYIFTFIGVFFLGVFTGLSYQKNHSQIEIQQITIPEKTALSVIEITEVSPLGIKGNISGNDARLVSNSEILEIKKDQSFQFNTETTYKNISAVIPKDALYFASKRGSKLYEANNTKQLEKMSPENLIFFSSQEEAITQGYTP